MAKARGIQRERFTDTGIRTNAEAEGELLDRIATPDTGGAETVSIPHVAEALSYRLLTHLT